MLDTNCRKHFDSLFDCLADLFNKLHLAPNHITIASLLTGIICAIFIYFDAWLLSFLLLWLSGLLDAVDGALARKKGDSSPFGTLLDICCDRIVELSVIFAFALKFEHLRLLFIILLSSILMCMIIFLTAGIFTHKEHTKSFYYQPGLMERSEAFIFFSLMIVFESYIEYTIILMSLCIFYTCVQRFLEAYKYLK